MERSCSQAAWGCWTLPPCLRSVVLLDLRSAVRLQSDRCTRSPRPPRTRWSRWRRPRSRRPARRSKQPHPRLRCSLEDSTRCVQSCETTSYSSMGNSDRLSMFRFIVQAIQNISSVVCRVDISTCLVSMPSSKALISTCLIFGIFAQRLAAVTCHMCICKLYMCFQNKYIIYYIMHVKYEMVFFTSGCLLFEGSVQKANYS